MVLAAVLMFGLVSLSWTPAIAQGATIDPYAVCRGSSSSAEQKKCEAGVDAKIAADPYAACSGASSRDDQIKCEAEVDAKKAETAATKSTTNSPSSSSSTCANITNPASRKACEDSIKTLVDKYKIPQQTAEALTTFIVILSIVLKTLYSLLIPIAGMIGKFMSGDWVSGGIFNVDILIETLWQVIRNMVNIVIILYLVYVAGRNIVPFGDNGQYDIKRVLPKVALALVIVNFSFFFCRTVLSIANVTTTMAFSMPNTIGANVYSSMNGSSATGDGTNPYIWYEPVGPDLAKELSTEEQAAVANQSLFAMECLHRNYAFNFSDALSSDAPTLIANPKVNSETKKFVADLQSFYKRVLIKNSETSGNAGVSGPKPEEYARGRDVVKAQRSTSTDYPYYSDCIHTFEEMSFSSRNAMYVYAFNLLRIPSYEKSFSNIEGFADASTRLFISAFFLVMFFGISVAMLIAMAARTFFLWFMMMLSPIWVLTDVLKIWRGEDVDKEGVLGGYGKFLALAFLPTVLGVVLSVGFMMVHLINLFATRDGTANGRINMGSISLWFDPAQPVGGVGDLFATMMGIFALMALWVAVFAAFKFGFKSIRLASTVMEKFESGAKRIGGFVARTPLDAQILPFGQGGTRVSASTLMQVPRRMMDNVENQRMNNINAGLQAMNLDPSTSISSTGRSEIQNALQSTAGDASKVFDTFSRHNQTFAAQSYRNQVLQRIVKGQGQGIVNRKEIESGFEIEDKDTKQKIKVSGQTAGALWDHFNELEKVKNTDPRYDNFMKSYSSAYNAISKGQFTDGAHLNFNKSVGDAFQPLGTKAPYTVSNTDIDIDGTNYMKNIAGYKTNPLPASVKNDVETFARAAKSKKLTQQQVLMALSDFQNKASIGDLLNKKLHTRQTVSDLVKSIVTI